MKKKELQFDEAGKLKVVEVNHTIKKTLFSPWLLISEATGLGLSISMPMVIGSFLGLWLDKKFGLTPKLTLGLLLLGVVLGMMNFWHYIKKIKTKR